MEIQNKEEEVKQETKPEATTEGPKEKSLEEGYQIEQGELHVDPNSVTNKGNPQTISMRPFLEVSLKTRILYPLNRWRSN
jgi:hypothetical protein